MVALKVCPNESGMCCIEGCEVEQSYIWYFPDPAVKVGPKMCKKCYGKKNPKTVTGKRIKLEADRRRRCRAWATSWMRS